jgi:hypothetical protein
MAKASLRRRTRQTPLFTKTHNGEDEHARSRWSEESFLRRKRILVHFDALARYDWATAMIRRLGGQLKSGHDRQGKTGDHERARPESSTLWLLDAQGRPGRTAKEEATRDLVLTPPSYIFVVVRSRRDDLRHPHLHAARDEAAGLPMR